MSLLTKPSRLSCLLLLVFSSCLLLPLVTPAQAQDVAQLPFLAEHYDVAATLELRTRRPESAAPERKSAVCCNSKFDCDTQLYLHGPARERR